MRKRPSVLIVEPRQNTRIFLEMTLCHEGLRVLSACSLSSALLQLRVLQPDLIIVGSDGQEQDTAVAEIQALTAAPLLALGNCSEAAPRAGIAGALPYPVNAGLLCIKVAELLGGWRSPGPASPRLELL